MSTTTVAQRSWLSLTRRPQWLAGLAVALAFAVVCVFLAQWQWHRKETRDARNAAVASNYDRAPAALAAVSQSSGGEPLASAEWSPVALRGRYDATGTVLVRNRTLGGANGYLVVVPLVLDLPVQGRREVWLMRGWVRAGDDADVAPTVQPPATGVVSVVARLRVAEPATSRVAGPGQAYRLDPGRLAAAADRDPAAAFAWYGVVASEAPSGAGSGTPPQPLPRPTIDPGPHLAYTVQWYLFAIAGLVIWGVLYRRVGEEMQGVGGTHGRGSRDPWTYAPGA